LVEFLEGSHVVDGVGDPDVIINDPFCLALNLVREVRTAEKESNNAVLKESQLSISTPAARLILRV
jgi:hypothetical protein